MKQKTLYDVISNGKVKNKRKFSRKKWSDVFEAVPFSVFPLSSCLSYEEFFDIAKILEMCLYLNDIYELGVKIDRHVIYDEFVENLEKTTFSLKYKQLYHVVNVFFRSIIHMENLIGMQKNKLCLVYSKEIDIFKKYISYFTFSEFVRIYIFKNAFNHVTYNSEKFRLLLTGYDFINFSFDQKLWVIKKILEDISNHPIFALNVQKYIESVQVFSHSKILEDIDQTINESGQENNKNSKSLTKNNENIIKKCRQIPEKYEENILIWKFSFLDKIIIEDTKLKKIFCYDENHIKLLSNFNNEVKSSIIDDWIAFLSERRSQKRSSNKLVDIREKFKELLCELVEKSFKRGKNLDLFEKKMIMANKISPYIFEPWANIISEFISIFWPKAKNWLNQVTLVSPLNKNKNFMTYIKKVNTWSGGCLAIEYINKNFLNNISYTKFMRNTIPYIIDENQNESVDIEPETIKCLTCDNIKDKTHKLESEFICRTCRLNERNKQKRKDMSDTSKFEVARINRKSENLSKDTSKSYYHRYSNKFEFKTTWIDKANKKLNVKRRKLSRKVLSSDES